MFTVLVFILIVYLYSLFSRRIDETILTIPLVFTVTGIVFVLSAPQWVSPGVSGEVGLILAEITYAFVIFNGAMHVNLHALKSPMHLSSRLLLVGLPLTILCGMLAALWVLPDLSIWEAGVLACMLASTDTGLADLIIRSRWVPGFIREALNAESSLSDGLVVPFVMLFISLIKAESAGSGIIFLRIVGQQIGFGIPLGVVIGLVGSWLLGLGWRRGWASAPGLQIAMIALVPLCWVLSKSLDTSPFIVAFAAGITVRIGFREISQEVVGFSENEGRLLQMFVFYLFGMAAGAIMDEFQLRPVLYALLSLTLVRMLPIAISLRGTRLSTASVLFVGWFGPRGLASIVLGLVIASQQLQSGGDALVRLSLIVTVLLSIFAHGLSASLGIKLYARQIARLSPESPEYGATPEMPVG